MIITFYSYKGGVGRTQLLSNVAAYLCYRKDARVLCIDWDLEAPGIHYYFGKQKSELSKKGLIQLFQEYVKLTRNGESREEKDLPIFDEEYIVTISSKKENRHATIDLIPAGNYLENYNKDITSFDWFEFYEMLDGKVYIEFLKKHLKELNYDYILIDSRTGISDYSGICNIQMPDANVLITVPNSQNFEGTLKIAENIKNSPYVKGGMRKPIIFPILSRVDTSVEKESVMWQKKFLGAFHGLIEDFSNYIDISLEHSFLDDTLLEYKRDIAFGEELLFNGRAKDTLDIKTIAKPYSRIGDYLSVLKLHLESPGYLWEKSNILIEKSNNRTIDFDDIKRKISEGRLESALKQLTEIAKNDENHYNSLIILSSQLSRILNNSRMGILSHENTNLEINRVTSAILSMMKEMENQSARNKKIA